MIHSLSNKEVLFLGEQGENLAEHIQFDVTELLEACPGGGVSILVFRKGDQVPHVAAATLEGNTLTWAVTRVDNAVAGRGWIEIRAAQGDILAKTPLLPTYVAPSYLEDTAETPEENQNWVAQVLAAEKNVKKYSQQTDAVKQVQTRLQWLIGALKQKDVLPLSGYDRKMVVTGNEKWQGPKDGVFDMYAQVPGTDYETPLRVSQSGADEFKLNPDENSWYRIQAIPADESIKTVTAWKAYLQQLAEQGKSPVLYWKTISYTKETDLDAEEVAKAVPVAGQGLG